MIRFWSKFFWMMLLAALSVGYGQFYRWSYADGAVFGWLHTVGCVAFIVALGEVYRRTGLLHPEEQGR